MNYAARPLIVPVAPVTPRRRPRQESSTRPAADLLRMRLALESCSRGDGFGRSARCSDIWPCVDVAATRCGAGWGSDGTRLSVLVWVLCSPTRGGRRDPEHLNLARYMFHRIRPRTDVHWARAVTKHAPRFHDRRRRAVLPRCPSSRQRPARRAGCGLDESFGIGSPWRGGSFTSIADAPCSHFPDYLLLGVAVVISHVVTGWEQVARRGDVQLPARELWSWRYGDVYRLPRMLARPAALKLFGRVSAARPGCRELAVNVSTARLKRRPTCVAAHGVLYACGVTDDETSISHGVAGGLISNHWFVGMALCRRRCSHPGHCAPRSKRACARVGASDSSPEHPVGLVGRSDDFVTSRLRSRKPSRIHPRHSWRLSRAGDRTPAHGPEMTLTGKVDGRGDLYSLGCLA